MGINAQIAARIAGSKPSQSGNILRAGKYLLEILKIIYMSQGNGVGQSFGGEMFIVEMQILEAVSTGELNRQNDPIVPNAVGSVASYVINLTKMKNGDGDIKAFLMALLNEPAESITAEVIGSACSDEQPFQYLKIRDEAWNKPQKGDPTKDFTRHRWESVIPTDVDLKIIAERKQTEKKQA